jgi:uroporphyrinogen-III synthase
VGDFVSKPLAGKRIVVTRAVEQSQAVAEALREAGAEPVLLPLVAFTPPDSFSELDDFLKSAGEYDWVFFTSQNALRAVQERSAALGLALSHSLKDAMIAAVGPATAESLRAAGLAVAYVSHVHRGEALAEELASEVAGRRVFLPRSDRANPELIDALNHRGAKVRAFVAYKTVPPDADAQRVRQALAKSSSDAILFFSPSAVHHFCEILGAERFRNLSQQTIFVAIGPITKKAFHAEGVDRLLVASDTTVAATIAVLAEFFTKAGQHQPAGAKQA